LGPSDLVNLADVWRNCVRKYPTAAAAASGGEELTYAEAGERVKRLAANLAARFDVSPGSAVGLALANGLDFYLAYWAVVLAGGVVVPANIRLAPEALAGWLAWTECVVVVVGAVARRPLFDAFERTDYHPRVISAGWEGEGAAGSIGELNASAPGPGPSVDIPSEAPAVIMPTSGTTGRPKGCVMRHADLLFNVTSCLVCHSFRHETVHLQLSPMFHCTACYSVLPSAAYLGSKVVIGSRPTPDEIARLVERHRATHFLSVPTTLHLLATWKDLAKADLTSLRVLGYAGAPMPAATIGLLREKFPGVELRNFFGLTETTSVTHVLADRDALAKPDSVGLPLPEVDCRVVDEQGEDSPPGKVGELLISERNVVRTYWKEPERMAAARTGTWFRTGDLAAIDADGYLYIKGRAKDMIIVGGENVYALEVENVINSHPGVLESAVVGVPATGAAAYLGEVVKAVIVPAAGAELAVLEIKRHATERLASYAVPRIVEFRAGLPRNASGKVLKSELT
jgi:acyl-CoA synthetase (AMP-forming)/AMP-acid ligase II